MKDYKDLATVWRPSSAGTTSQSALHFQPFKWVDPSKEQKMDERTVEQVVEDLVTVTGAKAAIVTIFSTLNAGQKDEVRDWFESESFNW